MEYPMSKGTIYVKVPSGSFEGQSGWLCRVCLRGYCRDVRPWSWFGCEYCRAADRCVGALFGVQRFLALGQHSIMNNLALRVDRASEAELLAFADQLHAMVGGWKALDDWAKARCLEMARAVGIPLSSEGQGQVALDLWEGVYPWTPAASATSYVSLLANQQPWVLELEPRVGDIDWLTAEAPAIERQ